jgi:hypothetical protein
MQPTVARLVRQGAVKIVDAFALDSLRKLPMRNAQIIECTVDSGIIRGVNELDMGERSY